MTVSCLPQPVEATDDAFWDQFWADTTTTIQDVFALVPAAEIRAVREESPSNLATLCYKVIMGILQLSRSSMGRSFLIDGEPQVWVMDIGKLGYFFYFGEANWVMLILMQ